ncbi:E3 Ubiquitin-Protein Ligase Rlim [Manis pentadactyla]|nr:E3 Ubiquitin-Protein Ligase Rlim [Manis pentadactyla]
MNIDYFAQDFPKKFWKTAHGKWKLHDLNHHFQDHLNQKKAQMKHSCKFHIPEVSEEEAAGAQTIGEPEQELKDMERPVPPYPRESSDDCSSSSFNSYLRWDFSFPSIIHTSSSSSVSTSDSSPMFSSSSSDAISVMFDDIDESRLSPGPPTGPFEQSREMTPIIFKESNSIDLEQFISYDHDESRGLTKARIDSLPVRSFRKNLTETSCCICITDYEEGSKVRILPCSHSFHTYCIDHWLAEKSTCPVCRGE